MRRKGLIRQVPGRSPMAKPVKARNDIFFIFLYNFFCNQSMKKSLLFPFNFKIFNTRMLNFYGLRSKKIKIQQGFWTDIKHF